MLTQREVTPQAAQKNLLILERLYPDTTNNHRSVAIEINGPIQIELFKNALLKVYRRHEMLRAVVKPALNQSTFLIQSAANFSTDSLPLLTLQSPSLIERPPLAALPTTLSELQHKDFLESTFSLEHGPLWRAVLIKYNDTHYQFAMLFNHIIVDETSIGVIFKDLSAYYNAALLENPSLEPEPIPSITELSFSHTDQESRLQYWREHLKNVTTLSLQTDFAPQKSFTFSGQRHRFALTSDLMTPLEKNTAFNGYSLNQILLAALYVLLYRYSDETDICLGITSANRRHSDIPESTMSQFVNCFFNSVPLRLAFKKNSTFPELLQQVKTNLGNALKNQLPLDTIWQQALTPENKERFQTATPFNILLVLNRLKPTLTLDSTTATYPIELDLGRSKFPYFGINLDEMPDGSYQCFIEFNTDLFTENTITRILAHFEQILQFLSTHPDCTISTIPLLLEEEKKLLTQFNDTTPTIPAEPVLFPDYAHTMALAHPEKTAVIFHEDVSHHTAMTYLELDQQSSQLANYINAQHTESKKMIGVCLTRSINLLVAIIAALKTGGVLVTLDDEDTPALHHKIKSSSLSLILIDDKTSAYFSEYHLPVINLNDVSVSHDIKASDPTYYPPKINAKDLAYLMYTSGTSGELPSPKGVVVSHGSFANLIPALQAQNFDEGTKIISTALPTFDAFLYDVVVALITHGQLHLTKSEVRYSPSFLEAIINQHNINYGVFLPSVLSQLNPQLPLTRVTSMGAAPHEDTLRLWHNARSSRWIENGLGHTETGICLSLQRYLPNQHHTLVGHPIQSMKMFILNPTNLSICPLGVPGEIYVTGPGLADGYINNPELTQKKFPLLVYNESECKFEPVQTNSHTTDAIHFYATGDFACYQQLNDTLSIRFIGRKDRQIKLNGVRIDLDEVENIMRGSPLISQITIIPNHDITALTAYVVPANSSVTLEDLTKHMRKFLTKTHLPSIAYPNTYFVLPELPLTQNGKIDTKQLPQPTFHHHYPTQPLTPLQNTLLKIWEKVLSKSIPPTAIHCPFKELGGNSLSIATLEIEINNSQNGLQLTRYIPIGSVLSLHMTIASLANKVAPFLKPAHSIIPLGPNTYMNAGKITFYTPKSSTPYSADQMPMEPKTGSSQYPSNTLQ